MATQSRRPEDLLNTHIDAILHGGPSPRPAPDSSGHPELDDLLAIAGLLAEALGTPEPRPAARLAGRDRFLDAARRRTRSLPVPAAPPALSRNGVAPSNVLPLPVRPRA